MWVGGHRLAAAKGAREMRLDHLGWLGDAFCVTYLVVCGR